MVKADRTCLGLEYFVTEGDAWWSLPDDDLVARATAELEALHLVPPGAVEGGYVVRMPKAYPVYDAAYVDNVEVVRAWLAERAAPRLNARGEGQHEVRQPAAGGMEVHVPLAGQAMAKVEDVDGQQLAGEPAAPFEVGLHHRVAVEAPQLHVAEMGAQQCGQAV